MLLRIMPRQFEKTPKLAFMWTTFAEYTGFAGAVGSAVNGIRMLGFPLELVNAFYMPLPAIEAKVLIF